MQKSHLSWQNDAEKKLCLNIAEQQAQADYQAFWRDEASRLHWHQPFSEVHDGRFSGGLWFKNGMLNASFICIDRHIQYGKAKAIAIIAETESGDVRKISYEELHKLTCDISTRLHENGIKAQDRVIIYMPLVPEAIAAMLAVTRLGAIHTVVFGGFAKEALIDRIHDCKAEAIITSDYTVRKSQRIELKNTVIEALKDERTVSIKTVLCFGKPSTNTEPRLLYFSPPKSWPDEVANPQAFEANHPLFILYTSGTTGKPKGIWHATGGYLCQAVSTTAWVFDLNDSDLFWCTADLGWITGHSYMCYGPLALGKSLLIFEGALTQPGPERVYEMIDRHKVSVLYTAPTAIRMFMQCGEEHKGSSDLSSLRLLGSVGEPINPEAWRWYKRVFGHDRCQIIDTWWQTETGTMMIAPIPPFSNQKAGSASKPFIGIDAAIVDEQGQECAPLDSGYLVIKKSWPSLARGVWGDNERFHNTYFTKMPGYYFTGDGALIDADGDFHIGGRIDDVLNISGHRLGTAEVESALLEHRSVAEAAAIGIPDAITGQRLIAYVALSSPTLLSPSLIDELKAQVAKSIGSFAKPAEVIFVRALPKTRSGKIMRRLLRSKAMGEEITADISTIEDGSVLAELNEH